MVVHNLYWYWLPPLHGLSAATRYLHAHSGQGRLSSAIFSNLLPRYIESQLRQAIFESLTAEFAARRVAMIAASENAEEIIGELTQTYNRARQEAITKELLEVVSGSEALAK